MVWTCAVCTFENREDGATRCHICEVKRGETLEEENSKKLTKKPNEKKGNANNKTTKTSAKKTVQSTLFGGVVPKGDEKQKSKKRKQESMVAGKPKASKIASVATDCCAKDLPFAVLKKRTKKAMKEVFRIQKLRNLQVDAINCVLLRQSQVVVMATGSGKSLCFQLPAVVLGGTSIVISPLIALMVDQVQALIDKGIEAAVISSSNGERKNMDVMERLLGRSLRARKKPSGQLKPITLLYCTPEQIQTDRFRNALTELNEENRLTLFAVDEAHCLSSWGHDFRPAYRKLGWLRENFPLVPCMACTATATPKVIEDIQTILHLKDRPCHVGSFDRQNIHYKVRFKQTLDNMSPAGAIGDLTDFIKRRHEHAKKNSEPCSGIVYVHKREDTSQLAHAIMNATGIRAAGYHAGLKAAERTKVQEDWTSGAIKIAIATNAFGMGIDLAHVRYVVHWSIAKSVEAFYQESGRAGRDGLPSYSLLYYSKDDASKFRFLIETTSKDSDKSARALDALQKMVDYCVTPCCRRMYLLKHFGEKNVDPKIVCQKSCDYCIDPAKVERAIEGASAVNDFTFHTRPTMAEPSSREAQWMLEFGDDDPTADELDANWSIGGLGITAQAPMDGEIDIAATKKPPADVSSILSKYGKYEAASIECKQNQENGFVSFRAKSDASSKSKKSHSIVVPEYFRDKVLSNPSAQREKKAQVRDKSSADYSAEADSTHEALAETKAKLAHLRELQAASKRRSTAPPPPPSVSFTRTKR